MPFQKGQSGNPKGRQPKGQTVTDLLRTKLDKAAFVDRVIDFAMNESAKDAAPYIKLILEYLDGKPSQPIENNGGMLIRVQYANTDDNDADTS